MKNGTAEVTLLKTLIDIPSVTGSESAIGTYLEKKLQSLGLNAETFAVDGDRKCVYGAVGTPRVVLQAHMDVVPPHLSASEDAENVYGRGACDTKGSIACMLTAAERAITDGITDFGLLFTVGEEVDFAGARKLQEFVQKLGAFLIVGEPSNLEVVNAHFGILVLRVSCSGQAAHSSEPQRGINAIDILSDVLVGPIRELELFPGTLMSVVRIEGGKADNIIPDAASALLSFRIAPEDERDYLQDIRVKLPERAQVEMVQGLRPVSCAIPASLDFLGTGHSVKYCTELSFFKKGIVLGPGDIAVAHRADEFVSKAQLSQAVALYHQVLMKFR